jgi:type II secretory pathway component PulF
VRFDCARGVIVVPVFVIAFYVVLTLLLLHYLFPRLVELSLIKVSAAIALVTRVYKSESGNIFEYKALTNWCIYYLITR